MESLLALQIGTTAVENFGLALMVGALACSQFFASDVPASAALVQKKLSRVFAAGAIVTFIASLFAFWFAVALMADVTLRDALPMLAATVATTQVGHAWLVGIAMLALLIGASRISIAHQRMRVFVWLGIAILILSRSAASHAAAQANASVAILIDTVHFFATSLWLGGVLTASFIVMPLLMHRGERQCASEFNLFASFLSRTATAALILVLVSGAYKSWSGLGVVSNFISTEYGNILAFKLVLVAVAIALGAINRFIVMPLLRDTEGASANAMLDARHWFSRILTIESGVLLAVLVAASLLSFTSPVGS